VEQLLPLCFVIDYASVLNMPRPAEENPLETANLPITFERQSSRSPSDSRGLHQAWARIERENTAAAARLDEGQFSTY
jgi:hypothetical protein